MKVTTQALRSALYQASNQLKNKAILIATECAEKPYSDLPISMYKDEVGHM